MKSIVAISAVIFTVGFVTLPVVWGDSDFRWSEVEEYKHRLNDIKVTVDPVYKEECGSCHMAYPAGLLSAHSWDKIMRGLEDHFDDNAELDAETYQLINQFLEANSADKSKYRRSGKFNRQGNSTAVPIRITATDYFKHEHDEIPAGMVTGNPEVKSFSQCDSCHSKAELGSFNEDDVRIPGYGRWDD